MKVPLLNLLAYCRKAQIFIFCVNAELLPDAGFFHESIGEICIKMLFESSQAHISTLSTTANTLTGIARLLNSI